MKWFKKKCIEKGCRKTFYTTCVSQELCPKHELTVNEQAHDLKKEVLNKFKEMEYKAKKKLGNNCIKKLIKKGF